MKIGPNCECVNKIDERMDKQCQNTCISKVFTFDGYPEYYIRVQTELVEEKKRAKPTNVFASFCPFCGVKWVKEVEDESP